MEQSYPKGLQPVGQNHAGEGKKQEEEGQAKCCALSRAPIPHRLVLLRGRIEESGVKLTLGRRDIEVKGLFGFVSVSHHPTLLLIGSK